MLFALPFYMMIIIVPLIMVFILFWIWMLVDCLSSEMDTPDKLLWAIVIIALNILGAILYLVLAEPEKRKKKESGKAAGKAVNLKGKKLYRSTRHRMLLGVCGGLGEYFGVDPTIIRLVWVVVSIVTGIFAGIVVYLIAAVVIPER